MIGRNRAGRFVRLVLAYVACGVVLTMAPLVSRAGDTSAPVTVIFTDPANSPRYVTLADWSRLPEVSPGRARSDIPVAPPRTFVELSQGTGAVSGCWSDDGGFVDFLLPAALDRSRPARLSFTVPRIDQVDGSILRLSRNVPGGSPGASASAARLVLACETQDGGVSVFEWDKATGTPVGSETIVHDSEASMSRPQPVKGVQSSECILLYDVQIGSVFSARRMLSNGNSIYAITQDRFPHWLSGWADMPNHLVMRYTRPQADSTYVADMSACFTDSGGSAQLAYTREAVNLKALSVILTSRGWDWMALAAGNQVTVRRGQTAIATFIGSLPSLTRVTVSGVERVALVHTQAQADRTNVFLSLYDLDGFLYQSARLMLSIPSPTVGRISAVSLSGPLVGVFWDQPFGGMSQVFYALLDAARS